MWIEFKSFYGFLPPPNQLVYLAYIYCAMSLGEGGYSDIWSILACIANVLLRGWLFSHDP